MPIPPLHKAARSIFGRSASIRTSDTLVYSLKPGSTLPPQTTLAPSGLITNVAGGPGGVDQSDLHRR